MEDAAYMSPSKPNDIKANACDQSRLEQGCRGSSSQARVCMISTRALLPTDGQHARNP